MTEEQARDKRNAFFAVIFACAVVDVFAILALDAVIGGW